jgi:hypothetical protein
MGEIELEDRHYGEALSRGEAERAMGPIPTGVRFDALSGRVVVEFDNGAVFMVPSAVLQGVADAAPADVAQVELQGETGLHWPTLDVDFTISGLMHGVFGTRSFMDASRRGGQSKSAAKAEAARQNGRRGGRPRKSS